MPVRRSWHCIRARPSIPCDNIGNDAIERCGPGIWTYAENCSALADVNAVMPIDGTVLMQAAFYDHLDVVRLLLRRGQS